jgi:hypothetical protein
MRKEEIYLQRKKYVWALTTVNDLEDGFSLISPEFFQSLYVFSNKYSPLSVAATS